MLKRLIILILFCCLTVPMGTEAFAAEHVPGQYDFRLPKGTPPSKFQAIIDHVSKRYGLDKALVRAVMEVESGTNPSAVSPKGAQGLMQIMPGTAKDLNLADPLDPQSNIDAGSRYLKAQLAAFGDVRLALAAYNAGPQAVHKFRGIPPYPETQRYVEAVANRFIRLKTGGDLNAFVKRALEEK